MNIYLVSYYVDYEGSSPIKAFFNKTQAEQYAKEKNKKQTRYSQESHEVEEITIE